MDGGHTLLTEDTHGFGVGPINVYYDSVFHN
jgi:hypothetical protein